MRMLNLKSIALIAVFTVAIMACTDKDAERKVAELEDKLAELENRGANTSTTPETTSTTATASTEVSPDGPLPAFAFQEEEYDFGTIKEGDIVEHTFIFTNTGEAPLIIESARASCGCTVPKWPKEPIAVGETGEIQVRFDSKGKPNVQNKTVTITANSYPKISRLRIKAFVTPKGDAGSDSGPVKK